MNAEQAIDRANKLYQMRNAAKLFYGVGYAEHTKIMTEVLGRVMSQQKVEVLPAAIWLAKRVDPSDVREVCLIMATALDMIERHSQQHGVVDGR